MMRWYTLHTFGIFSSSFKCCRTFTLWAQCLCKITFPSHPPGLPSPCSIFQSSEWGYDSGVVVAAVSLPHPRLAEIRMKKKNPINYRCNVILIRGRRWWQHSQTQHTRTLEKKKFIHVVCDPILIFGIALVMLEDADLGLLHHVSPCAAVCTCCGEPSGIARYYDYLHSYIHFYYIFLVFIRRNRHYYYRIHGPISDEHE